MFSYLGTILQCTIWCFSQNVPWMWELKIAFVIRFHTQEKKWCDVSQQSNHHKKEIIFHFFVDSSVSLFCNLFLVRLLLNLSTIFRLNEQQTKIVLNFQCKTLFLHTKSQFSLLYFRIKNLFFQHWILNTCVASWKCHENLLDFPCSSFSRRLKKILNFPTHISLLSSETILYDPQQRWPHKHWLGHVDFLPFHWYFGNGTHTTVSFISQNNQWKTFSACVFLLILLTRGKNCRLVLA